MYLVFTTPKCGRCLQVKNEFIKKGIKFKEINIAESQENLELAKKYGIQFGGTIIDSKTGKQITLEELK